MFEQVLKAIKKYDRIIIHRHTNPDGDAIGAQVGMKYIIKENFPEKEVYIVGDDPKRYGFIEGSAPDEVSDGDYDGALAMILDTGSSALISDGRYVCAAERVRLDHHIFCEKIAETEVIDTGFESCCGLVTAFAEECGLDVSVAAAKALYTGTVTDSGRFRYDSASAGTFRRAAFLMERKFKTADIYSNLYADDLDMMRLRAKFVLKITKTEAPLAYVYTTSDELAELGYDTFTVSRGMVNTMSDIRGVDIWVNFTEAPEGVLCEIRSGKYNINPIAVKYGGGGHAKASGATVKNREEAMMMVDDLISLCGEENE